MSQGFYGFPNILGLLRGTNLKLTGKLGATAGAGLAGGTTSGAPVAPAGPFDVGEMVVGQDATLWICTTAGTSQSSPGSFTQVAGGLSDPTTTKGDLIVHGASTTRLGVGSNDSVLIADSAQSLGVRWGASPAGAGGALTQLAQTILGSTAATISFSSISGAYSSLMLAYTARATGANGFEQGFLQFNGDTAGNYDQVVWDSGGAGTAVNQVKVPFGYISGGSQTAGSAGGGMIWLPNYAGTTLWKTLSSSSYEGTGLTRAGAQGGTWKSTSAITSIVLLLGANSFATGTAVTLYGLS